MAAITPTGIRVSITSRSACASCHARSACSSLDTSERQLDISCAGQAFSEGEVVRVLLEPQQGFKSLVLGYLLPLVLVLVALFALSAMGLGEAAAGLLALGVLLPYYIALRAMRGRMAQQLTLRVEKLEQAQPVESAGERTPTHQWTADTFSSESTT